MNYVSKYFMSLWDMTVLMHGYIIFGLIVAGIMREFISDDFIKKNLGGKGLLSAIKATVLGLPLPLCSCGVIPLAASLRKSGAGKGAVVSFFISTPMTGADSIIATYGVFGWLITLFRVISASVAAIVAGVFTDIFTSEEDMEIKTSCCCSGSCCEKETLAKPTLANRVKNIFSYSFGELLGDLAYPLLTGLLMAALITLFITPEFAGNSIGIAGGYLIAFLAGIPLYVCSISAIPIALSLLVAGFSPGAAFIFLAGAPATNIIAINVIKDMLGRRGMMIYLISIIAVTLVFAIATDMILSGSSIGFREFSGEQETANIYTTATSAAFLIVISLISLKQKVFK